MQHHHQEACKPVCVFLWCPLLSHRAFWAISILIFITFHALAKKYVLAWGWTERKGKGENRKERRRGWERRKRNGKWSFAETSTIGNALKPWTSRGPGTLTRYKRISPFSFPLSGPSLFLRPYAAVCCASRIFMIQTTAGFLHWPFFSVRLVVSVVTSILPRGLSKYSFVE